MTLIVKNLSKKFGQDIICQNFDFKMNPGQVSLLLGESGSGKTTILRMINGLEKPDKGNIQIGDTFLIKEGKWVDKKQRNSYQKMMGLVFQDYQLFPNLTVMDNICLAPLDQKIGKQEEIKDKALVWLERFDLGEKAHAYPTSLSGGQKQRVAIIRALMMSPRVLCFDEPTAALDLANTQDFANIVKELSQGGIMVLMVTHDQDLVAALGEGIQVIESKNFIQTH